MGGIELHDELKRDASLLQSVADSWRDAVLRAGRLLVCGPGCVDCCIGPFAINALDARRLRRGLERLRLSDPRHHEGVLSRAEAAIRRIAEKYPGDPRSGLLVDDEGLEEEFCERFGDLLCPALDPPAGLCQLYAERPLSCRSYGPPVRIGGMDLPPCRLCYQGVPMDDHERYRVAIDRGRLEQSILDDLEARGAPGGETIVAFALVRDTWD
jgi:Fe-S-cluster containining protein